LPDFLTLYPLSYSEYLKVHICFFYYWYLFAFIWLPLAQTDARFHFFIPCPDICCIVPLTADILLIPVTDIVEIRPDHVIFYIVLFLSSMQRLLCNNITVSYNILCMWLLCTLLNLSYIRNINLPCIKHQVSQLLGLWYTCNNNLNIYWNYEGCFYEYNTFSFIQIYFMAR